MNQKLRVLILEDRPADAELMLRELRRAGWAPEWKRVETEPDYLALLDQGWQIILADYNLPQFTGLRALELLKERGLDIPLIIVSGGIGEEVAVAAMKAGASDYVMKDNIARLGPAVEREVCDAAGRRERGKAEVALRESEERYRVVTETASDVIVTINERGTILFANAAIERVFGYAPGELAGQPVTTLIAEHLRPLHEAAVRRYVETGKPGTDWRGYERLGRHRTGRLFPVDVSIGMTTVNGQRLFIGIVRDITDKKHVLEALAESEARHRSLWDDAPVGLYRSLPDGTLLDVNPALVSLLGYPDRDSLLQVNVQNLYLQAEDRTRWQAEFAQSGAVVGFVDQKRRYDGTTMWAQESVHIVRDAAGREHYEGSLIDITSRRQSEEALRASEARYRSVVEGSILGVMIHRGGKVVFANGALAQLAGYDDAAQIVGQDMWGFIAPEERDRIQGYYLARVRGEPAPTRYEFQALRRDATRLWLDCSVSFVPWDGEPAIMTTLVDITERRSLEQQFLQAQKMEAIGQLAGGVAHDFNNLLTTILGYCDLLRDDLAAADPRREDVAEIRRAGERAAGLTRQLLAFSRRQVLQPTVLDLNTAVAGMDKMLRRLIGEDVQFETVLAPRVAPVRADLGQLEQVVMNLVVNARDAMPHGGQLTIETADVELDEAYALKHGPVVPGSYVMLAVSDSGVGMDAATQRRIFEPFFTTKELGKGTGLGLATVYGIVKQSGGYIWVYSEPGQGATFKIYLPAVTGPTQDVAPAEADQTVGGSETVLLLEDEAGVRTLVRQVLERYGYAVLEAHDAREALALARERGEGIQLLVTDVIMPGMSGPDTAKRLQELIPELKVLYMSGYTDRVSSEYRVLGPGVPYLQKPFTPAVLARKVRETLDG